MTRDELEAVMRREVTAVYVACTADGRPPTGRMNLAVETMLQGADRWLYAELGLLSAADRRKVLEAR